MMKRMITLLLALVLAGTAVFAQNDKCCQGGGCAVKRTEKMAKLVNLDESQRALLLDLNQQRMQTRPCHIDKKSMDKAEIKQVKAADKAYYKSLKGIVGKKNFRALQKYEKLEIRACKLREKADSRQAKKK